MYRHIFFKLRYLLAVAMPCGALAAEAPAVPEQLTSEAALRLAVENDPALDVIRLNGDASEGAIEQASRRPNPVVGVEVENFLGTGPFRGVDELETTIGVRQEIETAGKREKRTELARQRRTLVEWEREERLAELEAKVRARFTNVLLAQERVALARKWRNLAQASATETERLVAAAQAQRVEGARARLAVRQQAFVVQQAEQALVAARVQLATLWGTTEPAYFKAVGVMVVERDLPTLADLLARLPATAALSRFSTEQKVREAALDLEKAQSKPNFELFGGARYTHRGNGDGMFVAGVEMPWPLFDRNEGKIRSARARLRSVDFERDRVRRESLQELAAAHHALTASFADLQMIESDLLPAVQDTLRATQEGYQRGQFTLLSVHESRETLFEIHSTRLDTLARIADAQATIEVLTRPASSDR